MLIYGPLITSVVVGHQQHCSVNTYNALDNTHCSCLEATATVKCLKVCVMVGVWVNSGLMWKWKWIGKPFKVTQKSAISTPQCNNLVKLEYLAVYGRASMGVPVGLSGWAAIRPLSGTHTFSNGTVLDGHVRPRRTVIVRRLGLRHKKFFFVTDRNVTTWDTSRSVREARLKTRYSEVGDAMCSSY